MDNKITWAENGFCIPSKHLNKTKCIIQPHNLTTSVRVRPEPFTTGLTCDQFYITDTNGDAYTVMSCTEVMVGGKNIGVYDLHVIPN